MKYHRILVALVAVATFGVASPASAETKWITLGTVGGPMPSPQRGQPSNLLVVNGVNTVVDIGDGTMARLAKAGVVPFQVDNIVISHLHFDHCAGLLGALGLRFQTTSRKPVQVYGPPGTDKMINGLLEAMAPSMESNYGVPGMLSYKPEQLVQVHVVRGGDTFQIGDTKVTATKNTHYSFKPGSEMDQKFESLSFRFDTPDKSIVYTGDTGPSENVEKLAKGADLLVAEMIDVDLTVAIIQKLDPNLSEERARGMKFHLSKHHVTPSDLGEMATKAGVKELAVTHLAPGAAMTEEHLATYAKQISGTYSGKVTIASDGQKF